MEEAICSTFGLLDLLARNAQRAEEESSLRFKAALDSLKAKMAPKAFAKRDGKSDRGWARSQPPIPIRVGWGRCQSCAYTRYCLLQWVPGC